MAEVVGNEGMTVIVLDGRESACLADSLAELAWMLDKCGPSYDGARSNLAVLGELMDALGVASPMGVGHV